MSKSRNYCFTVNNYTDSVVARLNDEFALSAKISYMIFGIEVGESGTPHLQGYFELAFPHTLTSIKKFLALSKEIHLETRRGTQQQAIDYCRKDGRVSEWGTPKTDPVKRPKVKNSVLPYVDILKSGGIRELSNHPDCSLSLLKHAKEYLVANEQPRDPTANVEVVWFFGKTGTGKTRRAFYEATRDFKDDVYIKATGGKWFDGYDGESCVIFDDMRDSWFDYSFLLKLLDRYPLRVECKGGSRQFLARKIYVTSPFAPEAMYKGLQDRDVDSIQQLIRRVSHIEQMPFPWQPPAPDVSTPEARPPCPSVETALLETPHSPLRIPRVLTPRVRMPPNSYWSLYPVTRDSPHLFRPGTPLIPIREGTPLQSPTQPFRLFEAGPDDSTQCPPSQSSPCPDFVVGFW